MAIQETKIDSSIATSELFPETCQYNVFRKDRNLHGGGVMLLIHKDIPHMPLSELENDSESVWAKIFANKTSIKLRARVGRPQTSWGPPVIFIAGRPKAALLFWFFGDFRCGALLFMVIHVIYKYKNK